MATTQAQGKTPSDDELRTYIQALKNDPGSRIFAALASGLLARERVDQALQVLQLGLRANPDFADGFLVMARALLAKQQPEQAARFIQRAKQLAPERAMVYAVAGQVLLALDQEGPACDSCLKALDLDPECEPALDLLGRFGQAPKSKTSGPKSMPASSGTRPDIKKRSQTAPSSRQRNGRPAEQISEPFRKILPALGHEASERLEEDEQPFTALSSGSQAGQQDEPGDLLDQAPRSTLPSRPEPPPQPRAPAATGQGTPALRTVAVAQAIIDSYGPTEAYEPSRRIPNPSPPWSGRLLAIASVLALLVGIVAMLFAIMPSPQPIPKPALKPAPAAANQAETPDPELSAPEASAPAIVAEPLPPEAEDSAASENAETDDESSDQTIPGGDDHGD